MGKGRKSGQCNSINNFFLKTCLSKSKRDSREDSLRKPSSIFCSWTEGRKLGSTALADVPLPSCLGKQPVKDMCSPVRQRPTTFTAHPPAPAFSLMTAVSWTVTTTSSWRSARFWPKRLCTPWAVQKFKDGVPPHPGWGVCPGKQPLCSKVVSPALALQPSMYTQRQRSRGPLSQPLDQGTVPHTQSRPASLLLCLEASWCHPETPVELFSAR